LDRSLEYRCTTKPFQPHKKREFGLIELLQRISRLFTDSTKYWLYLKPGRIRLFRFIRSDGVLDVFGLKFKMPENVVYEYVTAIIDTGSQRLTVIHDARTVHQEDFTVSDKPMKAPW